MVKLNILDETKKLFPHWYDKTDDSNFTKHLKVISNQQQDVRHKLMAIDWSRRLEKPLQMWKTQSEPYKATLHFKVLIPSIKEVNIYKNPILSDDEEIVNKEESMLVGTENAPLSVSFKTDETGYYEASYDYESEGHKHIIPRDIFVLEIITWDDYRFIKGFPENDYRKKNDNVLDYQLNESFLNISIEEISYTKYLVFRTHKDNLKKVVLYKNNTPFLVEDFIIERNGLNVKHTHDVSLSYRYFDEAITNSDEGKSVDGTTLETYVDSYIADSYINNIYDVEYEKFTGYERIPVFDDSNDEYVYYHKLSNDDFDEEGRLKDIYDMDITVFRMGQKCHDEYDKTYTKRYNGYDNVLNDCFDHDYSLDILGYLYNVPRYEFNKVYRKNNYYYSKTYPNYNDRFSEDDYHYMKRIQNYISDYNYIYFPVLEFWKYYYTPSRLVNRNAHVAHMDNVLIHTIAKDYCGSDDVAETLIDEELDAETIIEYGINKATTISADSEHIILPVGFVPTSDKPQPDHEWYESVLVRRLYIVPNATYKLSYVVKGCAEPINLRIVQYDRNGNPIRTEHHASNEGVNEHNIIMPDDVVSIEIVLESDNPFSFKDNVFSRVKMIPYENLYMGTDKSYNSCTYDLFVNYSDIPTNLRLVDDTAFAVLFNRSLPLTRKGILNLLIDEMSDCRLGIRTEYNLKFDWLYNFDEIKPDGKDTVIDLDMLIKGGYTYRIDMDIHREAHHGDSLEDTYSVTDSGKMVKKSIETPDYLISSYIEFFEEKEKVNSTGIIRCDYESDDDVWTHIYYTVTAPAESKSAQLHILTNIIEGALYKNIKISRKEKVEVEELTGGL